MLKGYITKTNNRWTLTIKDSEGCPHRYKIFDFKKFCNTVLKSSVDEVRKQRSIGQYIVKTLGFIEHELWELDSINYQFP
jgi:hypothetical protein